MDNLLIKIWQNFGFATEIVQKYLDSFSGDSMNKIPIVNFIESDKK